MFARSISVRLKPNSVTEFIQTLENEIDPLLRKVQGFRATSHSLSPMELKQSQSVSGIGNRAGSAMAAEGATCW